MLRREFLGSIIGTMLTSNVVAKLATQTDEELLWKRLRRAANLPKHKLMRFRCLIVTPDGIIHGTTASASRVTLRPDGDLPMDLGWDFNGLLANIPFSAKGMQIVDDENFVLMGASFNGGQHYLNVGDILKPSYNIQGVGHFVDKSLDECLSIGAEFSFEPKTICKRVDPPFGVYV